MNGRLRNVLITGYGRNVSPEWVESALMQEPTIAQAVVMGDGEASLQAVIWPAGSTSQTSTESIQQAVDRVNSRLPDYARVGVFVCADLQQDLRRALFTSNGRPIRPSVVERYASTLHALANREATPTTLNEKRTA